MIYADDAPALENKLHTTFAQRRVNLANERKEFFMVPLEEIERVAKENQAEIEFTKIAEAKEYRETVAMRGAK